MKKIIGIVLVLMMLLGVVPGFAAAPTIENLDNISYDIWADKRCVECERPQGIEVRWLSSEDITPFNVSVECNCWFHTNTKEINVTGLNYAIREDYFNTSIDSAYDNVSDKDLKFKECNGKVDEGKFKSEIKKEYIKLKRGSASYYIYKGLGSELVNDENTSYFYGIYNSSAYLISFNKNEIDLYKIRLTQVGCDETGNEGYEIAEYYSDLEPNMSRNITTEGNNNGDRDCFFVCKEHSKCRACDKLVAANNGMYSMQGEVALSNYCKDHACSFIWDVINTNVGSIEGLVCKNGRSDGTYYCEDHKCKACEKPVVGVNMMPIISATDSVNNYSGNLADCYSEYCEDHYCYYVGCKKNSVNITADGRYCQEHIDMCKVPGCTEPMEDKYSGTFTCENHRKAPCTNHTMINEYIELSHNAHAAVKKCTVCNKYEEYNIEEHSFDEYGVGKCICGYEKNNIAGTCENEEHEYKYEYLYLDRTSHRVIVSCIKCGVLESFYEESHKESCDLCENSADCLDDDGHKYVYTYEPLSDIGHNVFEVCTRCGLEISYVDDHKFSDEVCVDCGYCSHKGWIEYSQLSPDYHIKVEGCEKCDITFYSREKHEFDENRVCVHCRYYKYGYEICPNHPDAGKSEKATHIYEERYSKCNDTEHLVLDVCINCGDSHTVGTQKHEVDEYYIFNTENEHDIINLCWKCEYSYKVGSEPHEYIDAICIKCKHSPKCTNPGGHKMTEGYFPYTEDGDNYSVEEEHEYREYCYYCRYVFYSKPDRHVWEGDRCIRCGYTKKCEHEFGDPRIEQTDSKYHTIFTECKKCDYAEKTVSEHVFGEVRYGGYTNEYHNIISDCTVCGFQDTVEKPHNPDRSGKCACGYKECKHVGDSVITYHRISAEEEKYSKCHIRYRVCNVEGCGVIKETRVESHTWDGNTCTGCKIEKRNITENEQICEKEGHRLKTYYANVINSDGYEFGNTMHGVYEKCEVCLEVVSHLGSAPHSAWGEEKEDTIGTYRECVDCGYKNYTKK